MSLGVRAMTANYAALQTTGNNIANANVDGYSRQSVQLATAQGQYTGAGFFGKGVNVATVTRSYDAFLTKEASASKSISAMDRARADQLSSLENVFPTGEAGIGYQTTQFISAMSGLASNPQDASARQVVLSQASELAARFNTAAGQIDSIQNGISQDLQTSVKSVNEITKGIADVNQKIASVIGLGQSPNDLLDQRDRLISQLSDYVSISTVQADDGTMGVFIAGGQRLVLGNSAQQLTVMPDSADSSRSSVGISDNGSVRVLGSETLNGGSIAGLLGFQNKDLVDARNSVGQMAAAIAGAVNQQQALGLDLRATPGAGAALFAVGAPRALSASTNEKDANGSFVTTVSLTTVDSSQLQASDYSLQADPSGSGKYNLTRLSDGMQTQINNGDVVDGMRITIGPGNAALNDQFLLQPVGRAANGLARALDDPNGLAAASPLTASVAVSNTGTATVGSLKIADNSVDPSLSAKISFTSGAGAYDWQLSDANGNVTSSGSGQWTAGQPIALNGFELNLNGVPANGDVMNVVKTANPKANNGNALAMVDLGNVSFIGRSLDASGQLAGGNTMTEAYAAAMADVGVRVQAAQSTATTSATVAANAETAKAGQSGVNLDEEAARLIQYQQSYQAAAKVLQVAQSIFDTLLKTAAG
jgi:flagellar hook-associated protein 1 FlgK